MATCRRLKTLGYVSSNRINSALSLEIAYIFQLLVKNVLIYVYNVLKSLNVKKCMNIDPNNNNSAVPDRPDVLVNSSSVIGYSYDSSNYILTIWYKGKKQPVYRFYNVFPPMMSDIFSAGGSIGLKARNQLRGLMSQRLR